MNLFKNNYIRIEKNNNHLKNYTFTPNEELVSRQHFCLIVAIDKKV